jgi:hypothetical protein
LTENRRLKNKHRLRKSTGGIKIIGRGFTPARLLLLLYCVDADLFAVFVFALKLYLTVHKGEKGIVRTFADIVARMEMCAALPDKNVAGKHKLTVSPLNAKPFGLGIAAVTGGTHSLFMCEKLNVYSKHY